MSHCPSLNTKAISMSEYAKYLRMTVNLCLNLLFYYQLCYFRLYLVNAEVEGLSDFIHVNHLIRSHVLDECLLPNGTHDVLDPVTKEHVEGQSMLDHIERLLEFLVPAVEEVLEYV